MAADLERFGFYLQHPPHGRRPKAALTVTAYLESVRYFERFCAAWRGGFNQKSVEAFVAHYEQSKEKGGRGAGPATIARHLDGLRGYSAFAFPGKPCFFDLANPVVRKKIPRYLTTDEWDRLLATATTALRTPVALRRDVQRAHFNQAVLMAYFGGGLRRAEGAALMQKDVIVRDTPDGPSGYLHVVGKGDKERMVAVEIEVIEALQAYMEYHPDSPWVFPGKRESEHLGPVHMDVCVKALLRRAGLSEDVHLHTLRHSFGNALREGGTSLRTIQEELGHSKIETTTHYTQAGDSFRHADVMKANRFGAKGTKAASTNG